MSTTASSAKMRVINLDQNPLGKYDMRSNRRMDTSGSLRCVNSQLAAVAIAEALGSTSNAASIAEINNTVIIF